MLPTKVDLEIYEFFFICFLVFENLRLKYVSKPQFRYVTFSSVYMIIFLHFCLNQWIIREHSKVQVLARQLFGVSLIDLLGTSHKRGNDLHALVLYIFFFIRDGIFKIL